MAKNFKLSLTQTPVGVSQIFAGIVDIFLLLIYNLSQLSPDNLLCKNYILLKNIDFMAQNRIMNTLKKNVYLVTVKRSIV